MISRVSTFPSHVFTFQAGAVYVYVYVLTYDVLLVVSHVWLSASLIGFVVSCGGGGGGGGEVA